MESPLRHRDIVVMDLNCYIGDRSLILTHGASLGKGMNLRQGQLMPCEGTCGQSVQGVDVTLTSGLNTSYKGNFFPDLLIASSTFVELSSTIVLAYIFFVKHLLRKKSYQLRLRNFTVLFYSQFSCMWTHEKQQSKLEQLISFVGNEYLYLFCKRSLSITFHSFSLATSVIY